MALTTFAQIEIRDTGSATNGGFYNLTIPAVGTDYSQQDAAQLSLADGDCNNSTTLTSIIGGFTAAMIGNGVYITGAGFTTGWYEIRTFNSSNSVVLDRNPTAGGHPTAGTVNVGGALSTPVTISAVLSNGALFHVKKGTYTWGAFSTTINSQGPNHAGIIGFKTTHRDSPKGADRPTITMTGTLTVATDNNIRDIIINGTFNGVLLNGSTSCLYFNVKGTMTNGAAVTVFNPGANTAMVECEGICTNGWAFNGLHGLTLSCYAHDSATGFSLFSAGASIANSIVDTCTTGISASGQPGVRVVGSVVYNCTTGISFAATCLAATVLNTIITGCTTGVSGNAALVGARIDDYNVYNNTTDVSNWAKGPHSISANPLLNDPANGDFTLQAGSPAINAAMQLGVNYGVLGSYFNNIGVYKSTRAEGQVSFAG